MSLSAQQKSTSQSSLHLLKIHAPSTVIVSNAKAAAGHGQKPTFDCGITDVESSIQDLVGRYCHATEHMF